jgi:hypothetical protein
MVYTFGHGNHGSTMVFHTICRKVGNTVLRRKRKIPGRKAGFPETHNCYRDVGQMARDFMAITATSAPSERVFSSGGDIITRKRSRLSPATLRLVICLRDWGVLSDDDDMDDTATAVITV